MNNLYTNIYPIILYTMKLIFKTTAKTTTQRFQLLNIVDDIFDKKLMETKKYLLDQQITKDRS